MPGKANKLTDVFKHIDMTGGLDACWLWKLAPSVEGRPYFTVKGKKYLAYRLTYELMYGIEIGKQSYLHQCDTPLCCNPRHGKLGTHQENMNEMKERERHGLSHHMVRSIKKMLEKGILTHEEIAELCGVSRVVITEINTGKNYAHVSIEDEDEGTEDGQADT